MENENFQLVPHKFNLNFKLWATFSLEYGNNLIKVFCGKN